MVPCYFHIYVDQIHLHSMSKVPPTMILRPKTAGPTSTPHIRAFQQDRRLQWQDALDQKVLSMVRTLDCFTKITMDEKLWYDLPPKGCTAGAVLKHCLQVANKVIEKHKPLIFKFGYCYDAHVRFYNDTFGYVLDRERWDYLLVVYAAGETTSPAFVEAALIQHFKGA